MIDSVVLSLSTSSWRAQYWTSRQFLMYELAELTRIVYATGREDLRNVLAPRTVFRRRAPQPFAPPAGLELLSPRWPRTYRYSRLDRVFSHAYVRRLQRRLDMGKERTLYVWHPEFVEVVKRLSYDVLIYHPYDMFRHFFGATDQLVQDEEELCRLADAVVTPHSKVAEALAHPNSHVIHNGVFLPAFPDRGGSKNRDAARKRPAIGYLGMINDKIDFEVLLDVFRRRPDWQLVMVGFEGPGTWREEAAYRSLRALENVRFAGPVPIDKAASAMAGFDVGLIPYGLSGWAKFSESPLKLYQYWAMGVPVVSSALPTLESIPVALEVSHSRDGWEAAIETQLRARADGCRDRLRQLANGHSWGARARQVLEIIRNCRH